MMKGALGGGDDDDNNNVVVYQGLYMHCTQGG